MEMIYTIPFTDYSWTAIVDHYFDHVHWQGDSRNKEFNTPADWVWDQYGARVDMINRVYIFDNEQRRNWFVMKWL